MSPLTKEIQIYSSLLSILHVIITSRSTNKVQTSLQTAGTSSLSFEMLSLSLYETSPQTTTDADWAAKCNAVPLRYLKGEVHSERGGGGSGFGVCLLPEGSLRSCRRCLLTLDLLSLFPFFFHPSASSFILPLFKTQVHIHEWKRMENSSLQSENDSSFQIDFNGHVVCLHTPVDVLQMLHQNYCIIHIYDLRLKAELENWMMNIGSEENYLGAHCFWFFSSPLLHIYEPTNRNKHRNTCKKSINEGQFFKSYRSFTVNLVT